MAANARHLKEEQTRMQLDDNRDAGEQTVIPGGLGDEAREMRNAGRRLENQEDETDVVAAVVRLTEAISHQEMINRQFSKDMSGALFQLRQIVDEVERIRADAKDDAHSAQQAALNGVNRAQQEAEQLTIRNLNKVTKKSEEYIDSMVQVAKRRIERLALITLPDRLFHTLKWIVMVLVLFILSHMAWQLIS